MEQWDVTGIHMIVLAAQEDTPIQDGLIMNPVGQLTLLQEVHILADHQIHLIHHLVLLIHHQAQVLEADAAVSEVAADAVASEEATVVASEVEAVAVASEAEVAAGEAVVKMMKRSHI